MMAACQISFRNSLGQEFTQSIGLAINRSTKLVSAAACRGTGLYGPAIDLASRLQGWAGTPGQDGAKISPNIGGVSPGDDLYR
jgi:hypothetical protein